MFGKKEVIDGEEVIVPVPEETEAVTETKEEAPGVKSTGGYPDGELDYMK